MSNEILSQISLRQLDQRIVILQIHENFNTDLQLPLRLVDFGAIHRNELSGALIGFTCFRRFQQAGIPDGVINVITGYRPSTGAAISSHMDVDAVSST
ncbi:hypothetical protein IEQ34_023127 [Dendrobium chrysotoxum]|uniref:Aldehyde dehydrogenase domain-containing protein n=1 Tax=Dendrobium chrysotoxum TaxID=161865 RepID=A0AAV7G1B8_DENCH|nr:hypothetical protein IEQ34_023127 [Dendrobium chrysotoxum]